MRRHFKKIVTLFTMAIMLITSTVPAMAKEISSADNTVVSSQKAAENAVISEDELNTPYALNGEFHYTGRLSKNQILGTVSIRATSRTVKWTVGRTGSDGLVNLELTNVDTGEVRHISAQANNVLDSMTWVGSGIPSGNWQVKVIYVSSYWNYDVDLYFYS